MYQGDAKCQIVDLGTEWSEDVVVPSEPSVEADDWGRLLTKHRVDPLLVTAKPNKTPKMASFFKCRSGYFYFGPIFDGK